MMIFSFSATCPLSVCICVCPVKDEKHKKKVESKKGLDEKKVKELKRNNM